MIGFLDGSDGKESACNAEDLGLIPGLGGCPGEGNGNPLQCSCLGNPTDRGAWWAIVHRVAESDTTLHACTIRKLSLPSLFPPRGKSCDPGLADQGTSVLQ